MLLMVVATTDREAARRAVATPLDSPDEGGRLPSKPVEAGVF